MPLHEFENETLLQAMRNLQSSGADVENVALVTGDGSCLVSNLPERYGNDRIAALAAAGACLAANIADSINRFPLQHVFFEFENGYNHPCAALQRDSSGCFSSEKRKNGS